MGQSMTLVGRITLPVAEGWLADISRKSKGILSVYDY